jgi:hypothetical protein
MYKFTTYKSMKVYNSNKGTQVYLLKNNETNDING